MFEAYLKLLSDILGLKEPSIFIFSDYDQHRLGRFELSEAVIYLKNKDITVDNLMALAHEIYHYYQYMTGEDFSDYMSQPLEAEAYTFQDLIMRTVFGIKVDYSEPLPPAVEIAVTKERIDEAIQANNFDKWPYLERFAQKQG